MKSCFGYIVLFFINCGNLCGQSFPDLQFNHINNRNGLSSNVVVTVAEDRQGFIWFGTDNGLNRYDGYRVKHYFHDDNDSNSLVFNSIERIVCDSRGRLWISTSGGLSCFLPDENRFINYTVAQAPPRRLQINSGTWVTEAKDGTIWIADQGNVIFRVHDDMSLQTITLQVSPFIFEGVIEAGYKCMVAGNQRNELIAFCINRVYILNPQTLQPFRTYDFEKKLSHAAIRYMSQDDQGIYWFTTWNGNLWRFNASTGALSEDRKINFIDIRQWNYNKYNWMLGITSPGSFYLFSNKTASIKKLEWNPDDPYSIEGSEFFSLYIDHHNNLWIGTNRGVNYMEASEKAFDIFPVTNPGSNNYERHTSTVPFSYFEDGNDTWLSKRYMATFLYDDSMHIKKFYKSLYPLSSTNHNWLSQAYYFFKKGKELFISTDSGLVIYDLLHETTKWYNPEQEKRAQDFRTIIAFDSNHIWIRAVSSGVFVFNTSTKKFTGKFIYPDTVPGYLLSGCNYLFKTSRNEIFLSGNEGRSLGKYIPARNHFEVVKPFNGQQYHFPDTRIYGMDEDRLGRIWMTSINGMFVYDPAKNQIEQYYTGNGRMGGLFRVCFDNYGNAWTNGTSGIWCYLAEKNKWINFNNEDGLIGSDYAGILARNKKGDIVAAMEGALAVFHPDKLNTGRREPPVLITEAAVGNKTILLPLIRGASKSIKLLPGQHSFSVDFAILGYYNAASLQYFYKLEPLMNDFHPNDNGHINFNALTPGRYMLHVKAENKAGDIHTKEDVMEIVVEPYWYQTWWFKPLALLIAAGIGIFFVRRRIAVIKNESALKQKIVETEMQALRAQMDPHFIFNSLSSIENFIMQNEKRLASDYLNKFARLIRTILDSSRDELVTVAKDMEALQLYIDLEQISFNNKFTYNTVIDPELLNEDYRVPSLLIQPYVENAIVHGLGHSKEKELVLTVIARLESDHIKYIVEDNGIGRDKAQQYKTRNKPNHKSVGLKITEERINIYNKQRNGNGSVTITDLYDGNNNPAGTRVEIIIKAM